MVLKLRFTRSSSASGTRIHLERMINTLGVQLIKPFWFLCPNKVFPLRMVMSRLILPHSPRETRFLPDTDIYTIK